MSTHTLVTLDNVEELGPNFIINSPRSLESCLRLGLDTSDLVKKEIHFFRSKLIPESVSLIKYTHYEKRRNELFTDAKNERNIMIVAMQREQESQAAAAAAAAAGLAASDSVPHFAGHPAVVVSGGGIGKSSSAPELLMAQTMSAQDKELMRRTEQMLEQERARLRKAKARQAAEIKSILDHETYLVCSQKNYFPFNFTILIRNHLALFFLVLTFVFLFLLLLFQGSTSSSSSD